MDEGQIQEEKMLYTNRDLKKLILPLVVEQLLVILMGMIDTVMISSVGEAAVSGVSLVDNINILVINITAALATGGAVVAGHFIGQRDKENATRAAWQLLYFSVIVSLAVTVILIAVHRPMLRLIFGRVEEDVMDGAVTYLLITALSICPLAAYNSCAALFRTMNDSRTTMLISALVNLMNIVGNAFLIYGLHMGVAGAAISTTVSRTTAAALIVCLMFGRKRSIGFRGHVTWRMNGGLIKRILYIGVPNCMENSLFQLGKILLLSLIATFGTSAIAANAVCNTVTMFNILPGQAIGLALVSVASVCVGSGDYAQVRQYTRKLMRLTLFCIAALSVIFCLFCPWILRIYTLTPDTAALAVRVIRYHTVMAVIAWVPSFTLPNTLRAAGDVVWTMAIAILSMWFFRIIFAYVFSRYLGLGLPGVWIAMTIDWIFRAICYEIRYHGHRWEFRMQGNEKTVHKIF